MTGKFEVEYTRESCDKTEALHMISVIDECLKWLGRQDSNLLSWYQKPESYRWTTAQFRDGFVQ